MSTEATAKPDALTWHKSSHSGAEGGECVEVARAPGTVHVRDSKNPDLARLTFSAAEWTAFVRFVRSAR
ncbi:DUF397 domain-containing protein [Actinacidiphila yeochonensis]|uniref:DUF397 domain-containing protein n=1 Tax=Actinacidiphila yeochonensis TaxID=89050 RepID=UPI000564687E|nr:DUF397 domain-containing protein [Actinacidiphila yeochonensis]